MSELEPTSTELEPTATERLRALLTERGVEWEDMSIRPYACTSWRDPDGEPCTALEGADDIPDGKLSAQALLTPEQAIAATLGPKVTGNTSDGYHTFNELYHHRAVLFSVIVRDHRELAWKSMRHHDGTMYDGMFIVGIETPEGQATYHYDIDPYWDMFNCKELDQAPEWDGHTPSEAIERIATLGSCNCSNNCTNGERTSDSDATGARQLDAGKVYLVEACDELIESWYPLVAYLSREAAEEYAESLRGEVDGVMSFARVIEMEVLG